MVVERQPLNFRKTENRAGPRISLQLKEYHEGTARCRTRPRRSKSLEPTAKRGPRPESADRNGQLLQEEAIADCGLLTRVRSRRVGNMLQHLQGLWRPCASAFSHHGHELDPLRRCAEHKRRLQPQCADSPEPRSPVAVAP